jgi:hypothetical protein
MKGRCKKVSGALGWVIYIYHFPPAFLWGIFFFYSAGKGKIKTLKFCPFTINSQG